MTKLPRLLDKSMTEVARLHPSKLSLTVEMTAISTASMTLPNGEPTINVGDFVEVYRPDKSAGIFRVAAVTTDYTTGAQTVSMEHGMVTLSNTIVPGVHTFVGWDSGDPDLTVTGYRAACDTMNPVDSTSRYGTMLRIANADGSACSAGFLPGTVLPVLRKTDDGWYVYVTRALLDKANYIDGTWDGDTFTGIVQSSHLYACTPYSNATGVTNKQTAHYFDPYTIGSRMGAAVEAGTAVTIYGAVTATATGGKKYKTYAAAGVAGRWSGFIPQDDITLDPGYIIGGDAGHGDNQFVTVGNALIDLAHLHDTHWAFGTSDFDESFGYRFEDVNLLDAILSLPAKLAGGYMWTFDQRGTTWRINLTRVDDDSMAELRTTRNLTAMRINVETRDLVTCVYPIGANGIGVQSVNNGSKYVLSENYNDYWHAEALLRTEDEKPSALFESALRYLDEHSQPTVSVEVSALDLSAMTGEPLDALDIGKRCRVPLPQLGITVVETITRLNWNDVYGAPEKVAVTLSNRRETSSNLLAELMRKG